MSPRGTISSFRATARPRPAGSRPSASSSARTLAAATGRRSPFTQISTVDRHVGPAHARGPAGTAGASRRSTPNGASAAGASRLAIHSAR